MIIDEEKCQDNNLIEYMFIFCLIWSLGSCLNASSRVKFEELLKKLSGRHLPAYSLYDGYFDFNGPS